MSALHCPGWRALLGAAGATLLCGLGPGCATPSSSNAYTPDTSLVANLFLDSFRLPPDCKRVLLLPLAVAGRDTTLEEGREALTPVFVTEMVASARCEFVALSSQRCLALTGRADWLATDSLPHDMLERLQKATGCDAVVFCQLTAYRPYPPVAIGWRTQLVQVSPPRVLWAVDQIFDGAEARVASAAQAYQRARFDQGPGSDPGLILSTPRRFGQFTVTTLAATLPSR